VSTNCDFCTWHCAKVAQAGQWREAERHAVKKRNRNDRSRTAWKAIVRALQKRDIISSPEVARLAKQYTDVSPDYALRRLQRKGALQRLKNGPRGLYVLADGENGISVGRTGFDRSGSHRGLVLKSESSPLVCLTTVRFIRARSSRTPLPTGLLPLSSCITILRGVRIPAKPTCACTAS
jgi:hypothetical protein